jgi:hypothetical protein
MLTELLNKKLTYLFHRFGADKISILGLHRVQPPNFSYIRMQFFMQGGKFTFSIIAHMGYELRFTELMQVAQYKCS